MAAVAKPSQQPRTESCVGVTLRSVDREGVGRNASERKDSPEIDRGGSSRPYFSMGKAESQGAHWQALWGRCRWRVCGLAARNRVFSSGVPPGTGGPPVRLPQTSAPSVVAAPPTGPRPAGRSAATGPPPPGLPPGTPPASLPAPCPVDDRAQYPPFRAGGIHDQIQTISIRIPARLLQRPGPNCRQRVDRMLASCRHCPNGTSSRAVSTLRS